MTAAETKLADSMKREVSRSEMRMLLALRYGDLCHSSGAGSLLSDKRDAVAVILRDLGATPELLAAVREEQSKGDDHEQLAQVRNELQPPTALRGHGVQRED
jgi:hypothetical protein